MSRLSIMAGARWIADNDQPDVTDIAVIEQQATVRLLASVRGVSPRRVAIMVLRHREAAMQRVVIAVIVRHLAEHGRPPRTADVAAALGAPWAFAKALLDRLIGNDVIEVAKTPQRRRAHPAFVLAKKEPPEPSKNRRLANAAQV